MAVKKKVKKAARKPRGKRMTGGSGWELTPTKGRSRSFKGTLLKTINIGSKRIAIFNVPKRFS